MPGENEWQTKIKDRIVTYGGWAKKWATPYTVGVADLVTTLPGLGNVLIEVKLEKEWNSNTSRTIALRPKQDVELNLVRAAGGRATVLVVVGESARTAKLALVVPPPPREPLKIFRNDLLRETYDWAQNGDLVAYLRRNYE